MQRISNIATLLEKNNLDAILITSEANEFYALGMHGEGMLIIAKNEARYVTDGRYLELAQETVTQAQVLSVGKGQTHLSLVADFIKEHGLKRIGFEQSQVSVLQYNAMQAAFDASLVGCDCVLLSLRAVKDAHEIAAMKTAQRITEETFSEVLNFIKAGESEKNIAAFIVYELLRRGAEKVSFDPIVACGSNGSRPHAVPSEKVIENGMFITMDFGCVYDGYCSDMTRTVALGEPTEKMELVYQTVLQAQLAAISAAKGGMRGCDLDAAARNVIENAGFGVYFTHSTGHSLGIEIHESPNASPRTTEILPVGAVLSAEPGIYLPGEFGVRIEDVLYLTEDGCENLTHAPKNLIIL